MPLSVRIWPIEFEPGVPVGDWGPLAYSGDAGADAPWRDEPSHWDGSRVLEYADNPPSDWTTLMWEFELSLDQVRELDAEFCSSRREVDRGLARATGEGTPFTRFGVLVYEWETGLE